MTPKCSVAPVSSSGKEVTTTTKPRKSKASQSKEQREYFLAFDGASMTDEEQFVTSTKARKRKAETLDGAALAAKKRQTATKATECGAEAEEPAPPAATALSPFVAAKVASVWKFIDSVLESETTLRRDLERPNLILVPQRQVVGACMRLRIDYEIPGEAQSSDVEPCLASRFVAPVKQTAGQDWVSLEGSAQTNLEERIQTKLAGHGLEDVNLLEVELEMMGRELEQQAMLTAPVTVRGYEVMSAPQEMQSFSDRGLAKLIVQEAGEMEKAYAEAVVLSVRLEREYAIGECPIAPVAVL